MAENSPQNSTGEEPETAPPIVLPIPGMPSAGIASLPETSSGSLISPQPLLETGDFSGRTSLADVLEQTLAEDGRFSALLAQLTITVDDGRVHLSGHIPTLAQKQSLLAAIRTVPGVLNITDALAIG